MGWRLGADNAGRGGEGSNASLCFHISSKAVDNSLPHPNFVFYFVFLFCDYLSIFIFACATSESLCGGICGILRHTPSIAHAAIASKRCGTNTQCA